MKALIFILLFAGLIAGCVNEDFNDTLDKTHLKPEYSIPLGTSTYSISEEFSSPGSSTPGSQGLVYYNDMPYPINSIYYKHDDTLKFTFNVNAKWIENAERISFHLYTESTLPTPVITQIYFLDINRSIVDSISTPGPIQINGGRTDSEGLVTIPGISSFDFPLTRDQINQFTNIAYYFTRSYIQVARPGQDAVRFYETSQIVYHVGLRIKLNIGLDQL